MPITAVVGASASLKDSGLVPERKRINATVRQETFEWLDRNGYSYIPSEANFFLLETKRREKKSSMPWRSRKSTSDGFGR